MSAATAAVAVTLEAAGTDVQHEIDAVANLVGWHTSVKDRTATLAGDLAELAGWAREIVLRYVDDEKPIHDLVALGFWMSDFAALSWDPAQTAAENLDKTARSDEFGAFVLGTSGGLLDRYRRFSMYVPKPGLPLPSLDLPRPDAVVRGMPMIQRASGLLVPQGGSGDPFVGRLAAQADGPNFYQPNKTSFVTDPSALGRPPTWARTGGRALGVVGTGLTLYDSYMSQWEQDSKYHPEWSTGERVASAGYNTVTEGGGAVAGGLLGAQVGATVGSFIPIPVVGTVGGALVGGAIGAFVGSKAGKAVGTLGKEAGEWAGNEVKDAWNSIF